MTIEATMTNWIAAMASTTSSTQMQIVPDTDILRMVLFCTRLADGPALSPRLPIELGLQTSEAQHVATCNGQHELHACYPRRLLFLIAYRHFLSSFSPACMNIDE